MFQNYLHFKADSSWAGLGGITPNQRDQFRLSPHRMRQLSDLKLPPVPESFKASNFKPFGSKLPIGG